MIKMDSRVNTTFPMMENLQPLDFTASPTYEGQELERETDAEAEPPVLDLSCKRYSSQGTTDYSKRSAAHPLTDGNMNPDHYVDTDRKSPFEGRSYMVTPPSEGDSPRKTKYEPIYNQINSTTSDLSMPVYPVAPLPMTAPLAASPNQVSTGLAGLVGQGHQILQNQPAGVQMQTPDHHRIGIISTPTQSPEMAKKVPRPFKAYPKDPLSLTMGTTELICDQTSNEAYSEFRKRMLESVKKTNEGTNIKMRRTTKSPGLPTSTMDEKDAAYWERRRKNNEAAKRSRDARRAKEDEIAIRAAFLEQENIKLKYELVALRNETAKLRCMVYSN